MKHSWKTWQTWIGVAAIAAPLALLLHELVHLLTFIAYGFPAPVLHYNQASFGGADTFWRFVRLGNFVEAAKIVPIGRAAAASGIAPLFTYLTIVASCALAARRPSPFVVALGLVSNIRVLPSALVLVVTMLGGAASTREDEQHVAFLTGTPELAFCAIGCLVMVVSVAWLYQCVPAGKRTVAMVGTLIGAIGGLTLYSMVLGPLVLP